MHSVSGPSSLCIVPSRFGEMGIVWSVMGKHPKIRRVLLPQSSESILRRAEFRFPGVKVASCIDLDGVAREVESFLEGESVAFSLDIVHMGSCPAFQQKVLRAEHAIPRGAVSTYGRIAAHIGTPRGARAVGRALAANPFPIIVPCHRAIRSDGSLGGYQGGTEMKRALLEMEGVEFDRSGRALMKRVFY